jgi:excisionase family DNA binding protein
MSPNPFAPLVDAIAEAVVLKLGNTSGVPRLLSKKAAAEYLAMSEGSLSEKCANGQIAAIRGDRMIRFDRKDLDAWIEENRTI